MSRSISIIFLCAFLHINCVYTKIPDYIKICSKTQDSSKCMLENYNNAIKVLGKNGEPSYKIQNLHKFIVPKIEMQASRELQVNLINVEFMGLDNVVMEDITFSETELHLKARLDRLDFTGSYDMKGKILILPIEGDGPMHITLLDFNIDYVAKLKIEERKGKKYYYVDNNPQDTKVMVGSIKKVIWHFDNLFGGDPNLGAEMNKFLNENWEDVFNEVKGAIEEACAYHLVNPVVNGYLRHIPIDDLFTS